MPDKRISEKAAGNPFEMMGFPFDDLQDLQETLSIIRLPAHNKTPFCSACR